MRADQTGEDIVAALAGGRPWWRLTAGDIAAWTVSLPQAVRDPRSPDMRPMGSPWDGRSDLAAGHDGVKGEVVMRRLDQLRDAIARLGSDILLPEVRDVRQQLHLIDGADGVVVDLDMGGFLLPVFLIEARSGLWAAADKWNSFALVLDAVRRAVTQRHRMALREARLRSAFERAVGRIGQGAAPLWFPMEPVRASEPIADYLARPYTWSIVALDDRLHWVPGGGRVVWTTADTRAVSATYLLDHRRRARTLEDQSRRGTAGRMSGVAAALIAHRGWEPAAVLAEARRQRGLDASAGVTFIEGRCKVTLFYTEGRLSATMTFDEGYYHDGRLALRGAFPETLVASAPGRPLAAFVDHAAFRGIDAKVTSAGMHAGGITIDHRVRHRPIKAATSDSASRSSDRELAA